MIDNAKMRGGPSTKPSKPSQFQSLLEAAPDAMVVVDAAGKIVLVNAQTERLFGYLREEVLDQDVEMLLPQRFREQHRRHRIDFFIAPRARPMGARLDLLGLHKVGTEFPIEVSLSPIETKQGVLVTSAIRDITERKMMDVMQCRLASIVESSDDAIISKTLDGIITSWNIGAKRIFGYSENEVIGRPITIIIPPDLWHEENGILERLRKGERIEHYETTRIGKSGKQVIVSLCISPIIDSNGRIAGVSKIARDITGRREAEDALEDMTRKLIQAQEQERTRIGRELHDDIQQRLAMLSIDIDKALRTRSKVQHDLEKLREQVAEISNGVRSLSHELHSSKLEYLGIAAAIRGFCRETAERHELSIDFRDENAPAHLPKEAEISLFRVAQEALHNGLKHSGVRQFAVELSGTAEGVQLVVRDAGAGFDVEKAFRDGGLGLVSMQERMHLVRGQLSVESRPGEGTRIIASVPLHAKDVESSEGQGWKRAKSHSAGHA